MSFLYRKRWKTSGTYAAHTNSVELKPTKTTPGDCDLFLSGIAYGLLRSRNYIIFRCSVLFLLLLMCSSSFLAIIFHTTVAKIPFIFTLQNGIQNVTFLCLKTQSQLAPSQTLENGIYFRVHVSTIQSLHALFNYNCSNRHQKSCACWYSVDPTVKFAF